MSLHLPYTGGAIFIEKSQNELETIFQALHHQFIASALVTKKAREINPNFQIGSMLGMSLYYPKTNNPEDILAAQWANRVNYFFLDLLSKGEYPEYALSYMKKKNEVIDEFHPRKVRNENLEVTDWGFQIDPIGLRVAINEVWDRYHKAIIVSENGLGTYDTLTIDKKIHDDYRIKYLKEHIQQMKICIDEGVNVMVLSMLINMMMELER